MPTTITTVNGSLPIDQLGICSMHEHIPIDQAGEYRSDAYRFAASELKRARELGLNTIVEVSPRRDAPAIRQIAAETGMQIVVCTGYYTDLTASEKMYSSDQFRAHMLQEIEHGIAGSGIFPGVIKVASAGAIPNDVETRLLSAAGRVQAETGLPVCVHSVAGCARQQEILATAGANLAKVYFSHIEAIFGWEGRRIEEQLDVLTAVVRKGSFLCYNNFGNWAHTDQQTLARIIQTIRDRGYAQQQVATLDTVWSYPNGRRQILWEDINPGGERRTYPYLLSDVLPWLAENGLSPSEARQLVSSNARKIFEN
jgi:phosphotriesterase-related protein